MKLRAKLAVLVVGILLVPALVLSLGLLFRAVLAETTDAAPVYYRRYRELKLQIGAALDAGEHDPRRISPETLTALARRIPGAEAMVLSEDGTVLTSTADEPAVGTRLSVQDLIAHARSKVEKYLLSVDTLDASGGRKALVVLLIPRDPGLRMAVSLPGVAGVPILRALNIGLLAVGSLVLFAVVASMLIARSVTRSVRRLELATRRIAEGDLSFRLSARGNDEVASLTRSFEHMRLALREEQARRSRFVMGVSHDLKTPLSLIQGYVEAIADGYADGKPEVLERYLAIIREKTASLEAMIASLIDHARMETGEWKLTHRRLRAAAFFRDAGRRFTEDALLLGRTFRYDVRISEETELSMDEGLVTRALENVVGNALRYTSPGGPVAMEARQEEGKVVVSVRDSGPGIPAEEIERIFDPFYRGSGSRREEGHGLGLAVAKWVIESHGWSIDVSSRVGEGTELTVTIPLEAEAKADTT